ncbi:MAG: TrmH family RNA methyltransferase [Phaeodactylibacter sp.]|uniref:TrmH family RNA methyltransferase n=1 Tax=Phaeodactylibacter sp. TaxID=1940289 RepID=UPI0032EE8B61
MPKQSTFYDDRPEDLQAYIRNIGNNRHLLSLLLAGITDVRNIGSLFRLADAARLEHLYFYGAPELLEHRKVRRVARATLEYVPYTALDLEGVRALAKKRTFLGLEITDKSLPYTDVEAQEGTVLVIGQEAHGIPPEVLSLCQQAMHLPMYGVNTSMNVAMAAGIAVYDQLRKLHRKQK